MWVIFLKINPNLVKAHLLKISVLHLDVNIRYTSLPTLQEVVKGGVNDIPVIKVGFVSFFFVTF